MPNVELPQAEFKVCMLGDTNVGKTSLVLRFAEGYYRASGTSATVGAFFITKRIQTSDGITCKVQIWDTAGQPQFRPMAPMYYKSAAAVIVCYDATNRRSYEVMTKWLNELRESAKAGNIVIAIASTKSDLITDNSYNNIDSNGNTSELQEHQQSSPSAGANENNKIIPKEEVEALAASIGAIFIDTSAKNNSNVNHLFQQVAERVLYVRECAKSNGFTGENGIPVTPGACVDDNGKIYKPNGNNFTNNTNNGKYQDERYTPTRGGPGFSNGDQYETSLLKDQPHSNSHSNGRTPTKHSGNNEIGDDELITRGMCGSPFLECGASSDLRGNETSSGFCTIS